MSVSLGALLWMSAAAPPPVDTGNKVPATPPPATNANATGDGYEVEVTTFSTVGGGTQTASKRVQVPAMCWMSAGPTGIEYYQEWGPDGPSHVNGEKGNDASAWEHFVYDDYAKHATSEGRWYTAECRKDAPRAFMVEYVRTHPPRFVEPAEPPPAREAHIDPEVLAHAARDAMILPTGTIRWNPTLKGSGATLVNMDTFVWIEGATADVQVRAEVLETGTWAQVDATLTELHLSAPGAQDSRCTSNGTPYTKGATTSDCTIVFTRSTANQEVKDKDKQTLPTATLTATATWRAQWHSSLDPTPRDLDVRDTTTTAEIPVAEVQTIVTR